MNYPKTLPEFDASIRRGFRTRALGRTSRAEEAWSWLPAKGSGWLVLESKVLDFRAGISRDRPLVHAEVSDADRTVLIRLQDGDWYGWELIEDPDAQTHCVVDSLHCRIGGEEQRRLRYRTYWKQVDDDGLSVWTPVAARLIGEED